ncbi:MAG: type II toxin-antitoxin system RelE/ParE family toxin [Planctomycetia bacterium]|nr:type II toxin-antitoxin system RelE/ParE family toxin [Planctomycetia bacterium]
MAVDFLTEVDAAFQRIRTDPHRFGRLETMPDDEGIRRVVVNRFPYVVIYELVDLEIRILAIAHSRRREDYWRDRR